MQRNARLIIFSLILSLTALSLINPRISHAAIASFTLNPDKPTLTSDDKLEISITLNAGNNKVTSFITNLTYPEDKLIFESIDTASSPFSMILETKGGDGQINIIKGSTTPLSGDIYIGKVYFKAKNQTTADVVKLSNNSAILTSDNQNILTGSTVQNNSVTTNSNQSVGTSDNQAVTMAGWISSTIALIINFFSSLFK